MVEKGLQPNECRYAFTLGGIRLNLSIFTGEKIFWIWWSKRDSKRDMASSFFKGSPCKTDDQPWQTTCWERFEGCQLLLYMWKTRLNNYLALMRWHRGYNTICMGVAWYWI